MRTHEIRVSPSKAMLPREEQLAWKLALLAADPVPVRQDVGAMIGNRIVDNAGVAIASRRPTLP